MAVDDPAFKVVNDAEAELERRLDADIVYFNAEIRMSIFSWFLEVIETLASRADRKDAIAIVLTTTGGYSEPAEKLVEVVRYHYRSAYFVVPIVALSAGAIFCMSGDKIFMDYSSSLGPIDPAAGLERAAYDQARDLAIALVEKWLVQYRGENQARANEIAKLLSDNARWHSHTRLIGIRTLREAGLEIEDYGADQGLQRAIRAYNDGLFSYLARAQIPSGRCAFNGAPALLYSRHVAR